MKFPCTTKEAFRLLRLPLHSLHNAVAQRKVAEPEKRFGKLFWTKETLIIIAKIHGVDDIEFRNAIRDEAEVPAEQAMKVQVS